MQLLSWLIEMNNSGNKVLLNQEKNLEKSKFILINQDKNSCQIKKKCRGNKVLQNPEIYIDKATFILLNGDKNAEVTKSCLIKKYILIKQNVGLA